MNIREVISGANVGCRSQGEHEKISDEIQFRGGAELNYTAKNLRLKIELSWNCSPVRGLSTAVGFVLVSEKSKRGCA